MWEHPPSPCALRETDRVAFPLLCCYSSRPLTEQRGTCEPSSSHLGAMWSGALGCVPAPVRQEQDRYMAKDSLRSCIHYATFATHGELKHSWLNGVYKCDCEEDEWGKASLFT
jgi:hypothetical protein